MAVGQGRGTPFEVGQIDSRRLRAFPRGETKGRSEQILARMGALINRWADLDSDGTDPGLVVLSRKPRPSLYWQAVRGIVTREEAEAAIRGRGLHRVWKSGRGVIGASAACAWRPRDRTWEVLAYRQQARWGTKRLVDPSSVRRMDQAFPSTFNNYDFESERLVLAPRTPCPVLLGIRGDAPEELARALRTIRGEPPDRWLIFLTNQGTDDHLQKPAVAVPRTAGRFAGTVSRPPRTLVGGHVVFGLDNMDVTAYEPAKGFRRAVRSLIPGDRVEVTGSVRAEPRTINLEKLHIVALAPLREKVSNPLCPDCHVRMKSTGRGASFRCRRCGGAASRERAEYRTFPRRIETGWYEPPPGSIRHISKPLKRGMSS